MRGSWVGSGLRNVLESLRGSRLGRGDKGDKGALSRSVIVVNDYAGHPFQIDLSRELASRGHAVDHAYCDTNVTPRGDLAKGVDALQIIGISTGAGFDKYNVGKRLVGEVRYGVSSAKLLIRRRPDVTLNANVPVVSLAIISVAARALGIKNVLWLQDLQAGLIAMVLDNERHPIYRAMSWLENRCIRSADHVVTISSGFEREAISIGQLPARVTTIPNWAPIAELPLVDRENSWAIEHDLVGKNVYLYSGTLGMKHRPEALVELSKRLALTDSDAVIVVISESVGAEWLGEQRSDGEPLGNLRILPFQPFEQLPSVLGSADVLVCLLEVDAGEFSVPSKVLTYLCAGRPVLGLMPSNNAATRLVVEEALAGLVSDDLEEFLDYAQALANYDGLRASYGESARSYAEREFPVDGIADRFERVFAHVIHDSAGSLAPVDFIDQRHGLVVDISASEDHVAA